jgi:hypothetical protein
MPQMEANTILEVYGRHSRCFDLAVTWTEKKCSRVKSYTQFLAGCYAVNLNFKKVVIKKLFSKK